MYSYPSPEGVTVAKICVWPYASPKLHANKNEDNHSVHHWTTSEWRDITPFWPLHYIDCLTPVLGYTVICVRMRLCCIGVWRGWSTGPMYRSIDVCHHSSARWCCKQCWCHAWLCTVESCWTAVSVTWLHVAAVLLSCVMLFWRVANISAEMTLFLFAWIFRMGFNCRMFVRS